MRAAGHKEKWTHGGGGGRGDVWHLELRVSGF